MLAENALLLLLPPPPCTQVFALEELQLIAALCQRYDCMCLLDEVYEHLVFPGGCGGAGGAGLGGAGLGWVRDRDQEVCIVWRGEGGGRKGVTMEGGMQGCVTMEGGMQVLVRAAAAAAAA